MTEDAPTPKVNEEQVLYARILEVGMLLGLALLLATFALYVLGIVEPAIPVADLPKYWSMSVHEYLEAINENHLHRDHLTTGWAWLSVLGKGDYLNFVGIAFLSGVTIVCFLGIIPILLKKKDRVFAAMALAEAVILTLAASGVLNVGH